MKKSIVVLIVLVIAAFGCTHKYNAMPVSGVCVQTDRVASDVLGDTQATANVSMLLGCIPLGDVSLFTGITGSFPAGAPLIPGTGVSTKTLCEQAAAYKAIENFEGADQIICPRFHTELTFGIKGIWESYTTTVKAKAVKVKP